MAVSTVIFFGLALFCTKGVHADARYAALARRMLMVEKELAAWKSTAVNLEEELINKFEVVGYSLKEEITETVVPPLIKPLVKQAIADNLNQDYIGNVISAHVIDEVQSLKANLQNTKTQLVAITQGLRRVEQERDTSRKRFGKLRSRLNKDIRATQLQLKQTEADLRDARSLKSELRQTNNDLSNTQQKLNGLSEDFVALNTSCVMVKHEVESCTDGLQEFRIKLRTDFQSITTKLNETNEDLLDTKRVIRGLSEDFVTLNTSCVMVKHEVESCTDGLQEFRLKLPTDFQSITTKLNETNEDLLDTKRVIHGLTEDLITLNISCGLKKDVKPSERNSLASSSFSQVPLRASTTTYPETTAATPSAAAGEDLWRASYRGDLATVRRILSAGRVDINYRGSSSRTPVMAAARNGHRDVVEFLLGEGADLSLVSSLGSNILHYACMGGDLETVKLILALDVVDVNAGNNYGRTAADYARGYGHQRVVDLLVSRGGTLTSV